MKFQGWCGLIWNLWDRGKVEGHMLPGVELPEWIALAVNPWDEVDRFLIDHETIGGE